MSRLIGLVVVAGTAIGVLAGAVRADVANSELCCLPARSSSCSPRPCAPSSSDYSGLASDVLSPE
jgi:hypothetical protein